MASKLFYPAVQYEFVDREPERTTYARVLTFGDEKRIFCIEAKDGWGKSWLLTRLYLDSPEEYQKVWIDLRKDGVTELTLMLKIAEKVGDDFLNQLKQRMGLGKSNTVNLYAKNLTIHGDVVGGNKNISMEEDPYESREQLPRFNQEFGLTLKTFQASKSVILFMDRFETTTQPVRTWLIEQLFNLILDQTYTNVLLVMAGSQPFECFKERDWHYTVVEQHLKGLPEEAIREYWLNVRKLREVDLEENLDLLRSEGYSPRALSILAELFEPKT